MKPDLSNLPVLSHQQCLVTPMQGPALPGHDYKIFVEEWPLSRFPHKTVALQCLLLLQPLPLWLSYHVGSS